MKQCKNTLLVLVYANLQCLAASSDIYSPQLIMLEHWNKKEKVTVPVKNVSICSAACSELEGCQIFQFVQTSGECVLATRSRGSLVKVWFYIPGLDIADYVEVFVNSVSFVGEA